MEIEQSTTADNLAQLNEEPAQGATPPELKGAAKKEDSKEKAMNPFDGTFHNENGARYFPNGKKVDGVNNWIMAAQEGPKPAAAGMNEFDGTFHHENGARYFPNGNKATGVNSWLAQEEPVAPATPAAPVAPAAPGAPAGGAAASKNLNVFDGTEHKNGTRFFPDGEKVAGVNLNLAQEVPAELALPPSAVPAELALPPAATPATPASTESAGASGPTSPIN